MYKIEQGNEEINSTGGISLVGGILNKAKVFTGSEFERQGGKLTHKGHCKAMIGILCEGRSDFVDIEIHKHDPVFKESLYLEKIPSEPSFRQHLGDAATYGVDKIPMENLKILCEVEAFGTLKGNGVEYIPTHYDVTPMDNSGSHKEGSSRTYKGFDGYAPMMVYVGTQGYMLNCELREGSDHCQNGTVDLLRKTFLLSDELELDDMLHIMDSGNDSSENMDLFLEDDRWFIIKRNPRKEHPARLISDALAFGDKVSPRPGKNVYTGVLCDTRPPNLKSEKPIFLHFEVTERTSDADGQLLLVPEYAINSWWSNIPDYTSTVIDFYHTQGTSEQFHSEYKTDLDLERLPSGAFATNDLILRLGMMAFNTLRLIGQSALELREFLPIKLNVKRRRLASVMKDLIYIACKRVTHGNRVILKFGRNCPWFTVFRKLSLKFC